VGEVAPKGRVRGILVLKRFQKALRTYQTDAESLLWYHLRSRRFQKWKFRRQHALHGYIVDFICLERKLVIELDGGQHADQEAYDNHRTLVLEKDGFKVIRFWNNDVLTNLEGVLETILSTPHPPLRGDLSHKGRGESF
jgi:very-short-patch-repair endonuclease